MNKPDNKFPTYIKNVPSMTKNPMVDMFLTYQFLKRIVVPFEKWDAYKLGIIDKNGKVLKKKKDLETDNEKAAWGYFDILTANLKKLLSKLPAGDTLLGSSIASYLMLKEQKSDSLLNEVYFEVKFMPLYEDGIASLGPVAANHTGDDVDMFDPLITRKTKTMIRRKKPYVAT
jgi:hypothetical protein